MNTDLDVINETSAAIIGAAQAVSSALGCGFLEKVYENAPAVELRMRGHDVEQQSPIDVRYRREIVGAYFADLIVDKRVVVELKAVTCLDSSHKAQCLNYLRATDMRVAILPNFGRPRLEVRRVISGYE